MGAALPVIGAIGAVGSLIQGAQANRTARDQIHVQQDAAHQQQALFNTASPVYQQLLGALQQNAGLGAQPTGPFGNYQQTAQQTLGPGATGADYARYQMLSDALARNLHSAFNNEAFNMGNRGLFGSSIDASLRGALATQGAQAQTELQRQSMQDAQANYQNRLAQLGGALNPGLGAGPTSAQIAGQAGQQAAQMGQYYGNQAGGALQGFLQYQALQNQRPLANYNFTAPAGSGNGFMAPTGQAMGSASQNGLPWDLQS